MLSLMTCSVHETFSTVEAILRARQRQRLLQTHACKWFRGSSMKCCRAWFSSNEALLPAWCMRKACPLGPDSGYPGLKKGKLMQRFPNFSLKMHLSMFFQLLSMLFSDHCKSSVFTLWVKVLKIIRINLYRLRESINLPLDHACTLLLKPAIRCASNSMFASLLTQSCRQVSPAVASLSANM